MRPPLVALLLFPLAACAAAQPVVIASAAAPPLVLPRFVVAAPGAVLHAPEQADVSVAFPRARLPLQVREIHGDQVLVEVQGAVGAAGVLPLSNLGVVVCEPGPLGGHFYAGKGNLLTLRSGVVNGALRVAGEVTVRAQPYDAKVPFLRQFRTLAFEADIPASRLCTGPLPRRHAGTEKDPEVLHSLGEPDDEDFPKDAAIIDVEKDTAVSLLDAPQGQAMQVLPASKWGFTLVRVQHAGAWDQVATGGGPYLLGWIPALPIRTDTEGEGEGEGAAIGELRGSTRPEPASLDTPALSRLPLRELPAGITLRQFGVDRATLHKAGYARVSRTDGAYTFVVAAVDRDVVVQGWVETARLGKPVAPPAP